MIKNPLQIEFKPMTFHPETGTFENVHLFYKLLPSLEEHANKIFSDIGVSKEEDYQKWLYVVFKIILELNEWFRIAVIDSEPFGVIWALNFESLGEKDYCVEVGGMVKRGVNPEWTLQSLRLFVAELFEKTSVYVVRSDFNENNRAARLALVKAGFSHLETKRAWRLEYGQEVTGNILSLTRSEYEQQYLDNDSVGQSE